MSTPVVPDSAPSSTPAATATTGGRGGGHRERQNRGGRGGYEGNRGSAGAPVPKSSFKGDFAEMNGHVFECVGERATRSQFAKMMEALKAHVSTKMPFPKDLASLFETTLEEPVLFVPNRPDKDAGPMDIFDYQEE